MSQLGAQRIVVRSVAATVLLVEDDHDVRVSVRGILEQEGYSVLSVTNGRDALDVLEVTTPTPQLILLDLGMPVMDGWELVARLAANPRWAAVPVAILTARRDRPPPAGVVECLGKPLRRDDLLRVVAQHCGAAPSPRVVQTGELLPLIPDDDDDDDV